MKQRIAFKRRMNNLLRDVQSGAYAERELWVAVGYIRNRPHLMTRADYIGKVDTFSFITSDRV